MRSMERERYNINLSLHWLHLLRNWTEDETNEVFRENQVDGLEDPSGTNSVGLKRLPALQSPAVAASAQKDEKFLQKLSEDIE